MKKIIIKRIEIENFKGIKEFKIDFTKITNIYGENALGKTSIFDAFTWLLFDKDSKNRANFDIKPLDENNQTIRGLNPTVTCILKVNETEIKLSKTLEEKWTKRRGEAEKTFTGNVTTYEINDIPVKLSDYKKKVSEIAEEEQFKLLTNPYYFSEVLNWKEARRIILDVAGDVSVDQVIDCNKELDVIRTDLENDDVETILKSKKASMKKLSDKKKEIPTRINELDRSMVDIDFSEVEEKIKYNKDLLSTIDEELVDKSKINENRLKNKEEIFKIKSKIQDINQKAVNSANANKYELSKQLNELEYKLSTIDLNIKVNKNDIDKKEAEISNLEKEVVKLREEFNVKNSEKIDFSSIECECPTCKRPFDTADINDKKIEMAENFNIHKAKALKKIREKGTAKNKEIEVLKVSIDNLKNTLRDHKANKTDLLNEINETKDKIENYKADINLSILDRENIEKYNNQIVELESACNFDSNVDLNELKVKRNEINNILIDLNKELAKKDLNTDLNKRKAELLEEERNLGIEIARLERVVMLCEDYIKTRVDLLENHINSKFKNVTFKLSDVQVNGAINEACEALVNGVPFSNTNTAGQINAGLDIINTLSKYFDVQVPVFIDNRESVNELIEIDSQVINLIVTKDNPLKIELLQTEGVM